MSSKINVHEYYDSLKKTEGPSSVVPAKHDTLPSPKTYYDEHIHDKITKPSVWLNYVSSLFPITHWIFHYNFKWAYQDFVAGITIGCVLVPQSMSYAQLATLPPQFGLYSSFVGAFIYSFFATSKDVCIGPVAVMSLLTGKVITRVQHAHPDQWESHVIATALSLLCGIAAFGIGILRLGWLLDFISLNAVTGFMTGSALNIISGQVPGLLGFNSAVNTRGSTYMIIIDTLKNLPKATHGDAAFGMTGLVILYIWKYVCNKGQQRYPGTKLSSLLFYAQALRNAFVIIISTAISYGIYKHTNIPHGKKFNKFSVLGKVPAGLQDVGVMKAPDGLLAALAPELPAAIIVLLLEHIAISKSFGRVNDYTISPNQELMAIGTTNLISTFFAAYPATGSFSRSALKAKCNVATPLSGLVSGACVLVAIYALTHAFFYIPKATLNAVIIHAVGDLIVSWDVTYWFYKVSSIDGLLFIVVVLVTVFATIEEGVYVGVAASCAILLWRQVWCRSEFLGSAQVATLRNPRVIEGAQVPDNVELYTRKRYFSLDSKDIDVTPPPEGVVIYRPHSWSYLNAARHYDTIFDHVKQGYTLKKRATLHFKPWNNPGELPAYWSFLPDFFLNRYKIEETYKPKLRMLVLDFSTVDELDITGIQTLVDLKRALGEDVEFHFVGIRPSSWVRRGIVQAGFAHTLPYPHSHKPSVERKDSSTSSSVGGSSSDSLDKHQTRVVTEELSRDLEAQPEQTSWWKRLLHVEEPDLSNAYQGAQIVELVRKNGVWEPLLDTDDVFFHLDLEDFDEWYNLEHQQADTEIEVVRST